ncbi:MAG: hypothetical protein AAF661_16680 [Pseudomonadota bacterium]
MKSILTFAAVAGVLAASFAGAGDAYANEERRALAAENFLQADANADGALNFNEFSTLIDLNADDSLGRAKMVKRFGKYDVAFGRADGNADGFVTTEELAELAAKAQQ